MAEFVLSLSEQAPGSTVLHGKPIFQEIPVPTVDPVSSLLRSQYPANSPYFQPAKSIETSCPISLRPASILTRPYRGIPSSFLPSGFARVFHIHHMPGSFHPQLNLHNSRICTLPQK